MKVISDVPAQLADIAPRGLAFGIGDFTTGDFSVMTNYDANWQALYAEKNWFTQDPVVLSGVSRSGLVDWEALDPLQNEVMVAARDFGIKSGITISSDIGGNKCVTGLAVDKPLSDAARAYAHKEVNKLHFEELEKRAQSLSAMQKDLVYLFANGFRAKQVAQMFEVSEETIKQRKLVIQRQIGVQSFLVVVNICARAGITFHRIS